MAEVFELTINGVRQELDFEADTPLLYVLSDELQLKDARFGCGMAKCGACSVLVDGREVRSCIFPVGAAAGAQVTTAQGIADWLGDRIEPQALYEELIEAQAPQCGYCYGGMVVKAAELLKENPWASREEIIAHMDGHICRCGTYPRLLAAVERAAVRMRGET